MLVGPWPPTTGGVTTFMLNVVNSILLERNEFIRFTTSRPPKKDVTNNYGYASVLRGGVRRVLLGGLLTIWHLVSFSFVVCGRRADIVQIQASDFQTFWEAALYVLLSRMLRRPVLMRLGGAFDHFYEVSSPRARSLIRRVLRLPDRLVVQSAYWQDLVHRLGRKEGVIVLPNWVPDNLVTASRPPSAEIPTCLFVAGTEAVRKGFEEVFAAIRLLRDAGTPVRFRLLALPPSLLAQLQAENLGDMVTAEGYVEHARMLSIMRQADIFLLPSRGEGFPNSLIEAMASGATCLATSVGAVPEILGRDSEALIPLRDPHALAKAITRLALRPDLRSKLAAEGQAIVRSRYVASAVLPTLEAAWLTLAGQQQSEHPHGKTAPMTQPAGKRHP
ncbi:glycosyltransferase [Roseomonas sp. M0104]|uniref:Glycosyltransferase n=1 Tax=Teichococcus coralli TaxID=2545983 RepID=A0A845BI33_9PROT|nr:glycosyltransferase family 4 protein [Pseudoroseomonas coralli]MXP63099.1 glycosyltransferase [Pseudoroseomonas coralli]